MTESERELCLRQIAENIDEVVWMADSRSGSVLYLSPVCEKVFGRMVTGIEDLMTCIHPLDRERIRDVIARKQFGQRQYRILKPDGEVRWLRSKVCYLNDENGEPYRIVGSTNDITELCQARERLGAYQDLVENMQTGLYIWHLERPGDAGSFRMLAANRASADHTHIPIQDVVGKTLREAFPALLETPIPDIYLKVAETRIPHDLGEVIYEDDRVPRTVFSARVVGLPDDCVAMLFDNVTERKKAEEVLRSTEEQLQLSQKMEAIGRLAGGVAHDFNNILTAISGYTSLVKNGLPADSALQQDLVEVMKAAERAATLTRQLLAFSRRQILQPVVLDVNDVVTEMHKMLRCIIGEDIALDIRLHPQLGRVKADPGQIEQIVLNLAVNSRDAMPGGGRLTIETSNVSVPSTAPESESEVRAGDYAVLTVRDTGSGMTSEVRKRIFEPFFSTREQTGLGLSTVYGIIQQSGGHVRVDTRPGEGATFRVYLPRTAGEVTSGTSLGQPLQGTECLLLVEDEPVLLELGRRVLSGRGYQVLTARNGGHALEICATYSGAIDLVLTDVVMPEMGGPELASRLSELRPSLRIVFMSGYAETHDELTSGGTAFLQKPFTPNDLALKVREVLDAR